MKSVELVYSINVYIHLYVKLRSELFALFFEILMKMNIGNNSFVLFLITETFIFLTIISVSIALNVLQYLNHYVQFLKVFIIFSAVKQLHFKIKLISTF